MLLPSSFFINLSNFIVRQFVEMPATGLCRSSAATRLELFSFPFGWWEVGLVAVGGLATTPATTPKLALAPQSSAMTY